MIYYLLVLLLVPITHLIFRPKLRGRQHLRLKGGVIVVSNHFSLVDPIYIALISPRVLHYMAKQELFANPVFAFLLSKGLFAFPVNRHNADLASIRKASDLLAKGKAFGIFPEGRRSATGQMDELEKGAAFLALRSKAPIVPIYSDPDTLKNLRIRMVIGEPMDAAKIAAEHKGKAVEVVTQAIADRLAELKLELEREL